MIERAHRCKEKYGLLDMKKGEHKDFSLTKNEYNSLRVKCSVLSKRHNMDFRTRKLEHVIRVYRIK